MKILLTHPFSRPYTRRGAETILAQLTDYLVERGHEVTVFTSKPGPAEVLREGATIYFASQDSFLTHRLRISPRHAFFLHTLRFLREHRNFDVVHSMHHIDACAARIAGRRTGIPYVYSMFGIPSASHYRRRPIEHLALKDAVQGASEVMVLSQAARVLLEAGYHRPGTCITGFIDPSEFPLAVGRDLASPVLLAVAAFMEARKGLDVLVRAFVLTKKEVPQARLIIVGPVSLQRRRKVLSLVPEPWREDVHFFGSARTDQLPGLYQQAAVTILPSIWEALGTVLLESLSCGTPVVGSRHSGIPDVVRDEVGTLFEPKEERGQATNAPGLAQAILRTLGLYSHPELPVTCHRHALQYSWAQRGPAVEAVYERAMARPSGQAPPNPR